MCDMPFFCPGVQPIFNFLELMKHHFVAKNILQEERKVGIILSHIPSEYYDALVILSTPVPVHYLPLADLESKLKFLSRPRAMAVVNIKAFYDRKKLPIESFNHYFNDLNRLAKRCALENREDSIKWKLFMEASKEPYFYDEHIRWIKQSIQIRFQII